jgi:hypothetical protein
MQGVVASLSIHRCGGIAAYRVAPSLDARTPKPVESRYTARFTSRSLILVIALVGFSPFGHTSTQFMIE